MTPRPNKTDAGSGSKAICRVSNVLRSPSPDPRRSGQENVHPAYRMTLRDDITTALATAPETDFHFVRRHSFQDILDRIAERFLKEGRRDLRYVWLWERFRNELTSSHPDDAVSALESQLQPDERYWFLASDEHGKYWVADATGAGILTTLREMYCFEYYVVNRHMTWLICENHHGVLIEASAATPTA